MAVSGTKVIASLLNSLYQTTDNGLGWSIVDSSLTNVISLLAQDSYVFAGAFGGIRRSSDYGTTWTQVYSTSAAPVSAFAKSGNRVFAGISNSVIGSTDNGITWTADSSALNCTWIHSLVASPAGSGNNYLYAATDSGVYRSSDNGVRWTRENPAPNTSLILSLAFMESYESGNFILLAGTGAGIYSSTDYGETWNAIGVPPATWSWFLAASGSNLFAGSTSRPYVTLGGESVTISNDNRCEIYRSSDLGLSWSEVDEGLIDHPYSLLSSLASSPNTSGGFNLFAGATGSRYAGEGSVFASSDLGATWVNLIPDTAGGPFPAIYAGLSTVLVGTTGSGMFRSTDQGVTWTAHDSGIAMPSPEGYTHSSVNAFSIDGTKLYAAAGYETVGRISTFYNRIMVSTDAGVSWSRVDSSFSPRSVENGAFDTISVIKCIYGAGPHLLVGTEAWDYALTYPSGDALPPWGGGVYHLVNNGSDWTLADSALTGKQIVSIVSVEPYIVAAAIGSGVFRSNDNGKTWENISAGLTDSVVTALLVLDPYLFAATASGVWRRPLSEITSVNQGAASTKAPLEYYLGQNFPNPFNPATTFSFVLPARSFVSIKIFDMLGREVSTIVSAELQAGTYTRRWNAANMASGVYFYRLQAGAFSQTKKLLLLK